MMRQRWIVVALAAFLLTPAGAVVAQDDPSETGETEEARADLVVEELRVVPEDPRPGENVTFLAELDNEGEADANASNLSFEVDGEEHSVHSIGSIPSDGHRLVSSDNWTAVEGEHNVTVLVDADDEIAEEDEENNVETEEFEVEAEEEEPEEADDEEPEEFEDHGPSSEWDEDNGTYTGDHIQVTVDEELPGLTDVTYLDPNASVFASVQLPGENLSYHAVEDVLAGETNDSEFSVHDDRGGHLNLEAEDNASIAIDVADGVEVNESDEYADDDDDEAVYRLALSANRTAWFYGEGLSYDNGTFTVEEEARLSPEFPPAQGPEDHEEEHEEMRERMEERREAGSQWDRSNDSFEGDHAEFTLDANDTRVTDYAIKGSTIPVFAEADIPEDNESYWEAHGKHFELRTDDARLRIVDVPPAILMVRAAESADAHLVVADDVEVSEINDTEHDDDDEDAELDEERSLWRLDLAENRTGWVMGEETSFDNGTFTVSDRAMFRAMPDRPDASENKGPGSMPDEAREEDEREDDEDESPEEGERGPPEHARAKPLDAASQQKVERALAQGKVSAEVHLDENDTEPVAVEMGDVHVRKAWAEDEDGVKAGMTIEAPDDAPGTTVTLNLDESKLGNVTVSQAGEKLAVSFDNETIPMADDLDDVLDAEDDEDPEYLLLVGSDEVQILVSVPHFSPHTIEVYETQSSESVEGSPVPGFGAVSLVLASALAATVAGVRKRR